MASELRDSSALLAKGNEAQFEFVYKLYPQALSVKSENKNKKPEELRKLDNWYHNVLPKSIQSRSKEGGYLTHEELVQTIKWKLARGKWRPRLKELITMNTPRLVQNETKKAIRQLVKKNDLVSAIQAMCNLKGVGPAMASAVLSAAVPEKIPYMSDECMLSMPEVEGSIDYTVKEYLKMVDHVQRASKRLSANGSSQWTPHRVEQVLFSHYLLAHHKPELLEGMPGFGVNGEPNGESENGAAGDEAIESSENKANGDKCAVGEAGDSAENSRDGAASASNIEADETTNDSIPSTGASSTNAPHEDSNLGDESNASLTGEESNAADESILSATEDSVSMPPPTTLPSEDSAPAAEAPPTATEAPPTATDPTPEAPAKRAAPDLPDSTESKRAKPDPVDV